MLRDTDRRTKYEQAIECAFETYRRCHSDSLHVLDFGAGTGALSLLALRAGARTATLVDRNSDVLRIADEALTEHGYVRNQDYFIVVAGKPPPGKTFGVLVSEILGTLTTSESMHEYLPEAIEFVKETAPYGKIVIPASATQLLSLCELHAPPRSPDATARFLQDCLVPEWAEDRATFVPTAEVMMPAHLYLNCRFDSAEVRIDRFGGDAEPSSVPNSVRLRRPRPWPTNHRDLYLVLEWVCCLFGDVVLKNTLEGYHELTEANAIERATAWGVMIANCDPLVGSDPDPEDGATESAGAAGDPPTVGFSVKYGSRHAQFEGAPTLTIRSDSAPKRAKKRRG